MILFETKNQVAFIIFNRPEKFNSFTKEMAFQLQTILQDCENNEDIRAIHITANGKAFCAGQDLAEVVSNDFPGFATVVGKHYNPIIAKMRSIEKPIVCAVNGVAAGAGANIALAGDITVATQSASFMQVFSKIGLIPDCGGTYFLPRLIGTQKAAALMMLGDKISATEAEQMGMIYKCFTDETFMEESHKIAYTLAQLPTKALGLTKTLLYQSATNTLTQQLAQECTLQTQAGNTADYAEGVAAFIEKRKAVFVGK